MRKLHVKEKEFPYENHHSRPYSLVTRDNTDILEIAILLLNHCGATLLLEVGSTAKWQQKSPADEPLYRLKVAYPVEVDEVNWEAPIAPRLKEKNGEEIDLCVW